MFNKISSFNIKSDRNNSWNDVFVAQPDSLKESLAGKIFVLAEFSGKKIEGDKIFNFIISSLEENYYNDEKLLLKEKIEGLKTENIFEASLAKTNIALGSFLEKEKINLNPSTTNLTVGVVFENHIHFSNFGKNRSLLLYQQKNSYEIINVETNAFEKESSEKEKETKELRVPKVFSSIISGEIPKNSFFVFGSESLLEYISEKELSAIISKLPPLTAAFQIKGMLEKINMRVPFFGMIIKSVSELERKEDLEEIKMPVSAEASISSLKNTEKKTEEMLSSGNLINISKISDKFNEFIKNKNDFNKKNQIVNLNKRNKEDFEDKEPEVVKIEEPEELLVKEEKEINSKQGLKIKNDHDFGIIRTLGAVKKDSNILKEKFSFKKPTNSFFKLKIGSSLLNFLDIIKSTNTNLSKKNKLITIVLIVSIITLSLSIVNVKNKNKQKEFEERLLLISQEIETKESDIEARLLYNDQNGANNLLTEIKTLLESLPREKKFQIESYNSLKDRVGLIQEKIYHLEKVVSAEKMYDFGDLEIKNLIFASNNLFALDKNNIYKLDGSENPEKIELGENINSYQPVFYENKLNFFNNKNLISYDLNRKNVSSRTINGYGNENGLSAFSVYANHFYSLIPSENKIKIHRSFSSASDWLKEDVDLSRVRDFYIDGSIYLLNSNSSVSKYHLGKKQDYPEIIIEPKSETFSKITGTENKLYLFDPENKRVAVLNKKNGVLEKQYVFNELTNAIDFAVDEKNEAIYFLDNKEVIKFSLKD